MKAGSTICTGTARSRIDRHVAQSDEHRRPKAKDAGSSPVVTTSRESEPIGDRRCFENRWCLQGMGFDCARSPPIWKTNRTGAPAPLGKRLAPSKGVRFEFAVFLHFGKPNRSWPPVSVRS